MLSSVPFQLVDFLLSDSLVNDCDIEQNVLPDDESSLVNARQLICVGHDGVIVIVDFGIVVGESFVLELSGSGLESECAICVGQVASEIVDSIVNALVLRRPVT